MDLKFIAQKYAEKVTITPIFVNDFLDNIINLYKLNTTKININETKNEITERLPNEILFSEFLNFAADHIISKSSSHPDYNALASATCVFKLHSYTSDNIADAACILYHKHDSLGKHTPVISYKLYNLILQNTKKINEMIDYSRDCNLDYFGIKTLERSYLLKAHHENKTYIIERPQHLFMRVALGIHEDNWDAVHETYQNLSLRYFTHATPTLFNAGTNKNQLSSCFLLGIDDCMDSILNQIGEMGRISKWSGGIGVHISNVRGDGSVIRGTNGKSKGIIPLCIVLNKLALYINQGGKRNGSIAVYIEPFHSDIFEFCELRKQNSGNEDNRARDLFLALWVPDLFMKRVENNDIWSLMCPDECPGLNKVYGEEFEDLYTQYEKEKRYKKQIPARDLWKHIIECQIESGFPYMCYKDNTNHKSNQKNIGTIMSSNLCSEITEYSDENETAVCNLASICLQRFVEFVNDTPVYNYTKLQEITRMIVRNLNKVIDVNFYPTEKCKKSNMKHKPMGIGVQGLAMVFNLFDFPFESDEAALLNKKIFETIYYAAVDESKELAKKYGAYETFKGSPFSEGQLQYHMWGMTNNDLLTKNMYDWDKLVEEVKQWGTRNSLLTALMPTASTAQIMSSSECSEPFMSNMFVRTTLAGEFIVINEHLVKTLEKHDLWDDDMRKHIILNNGSIQNIDNIPVYIKEIFKTAFEISLQSIISQSADRGPYVDQSQSMNLFMNMPNYKVLTSAHFYGWKRGLKTGMYYLRTAPAANPLSFGIDVSDSKRLEQKNKNDDKKSETNNEEAFVCRKEDGCVVCGA
jgi:ribonucleoside-diphosphate reductase alpha subunit